MTTKNPMPGDMIIAMNTMRAWETQFVRGKNGLCIEHGEQALVLATLIVGNQLRLSVLRDNRVLFFSNPEYAVHRNWTIARPGLESPTSGST